MRIGIPYIALHHARFLLSKEQMLLSSMLVSLLLCWSLSACSPTSSSITPKTAVPTSTCTGQSAASAPLITRAGLQKMFALPGSPFASAMTHTGHWIFVSLQSSTAQDNGIAVLLQEGPSLKLAHIIPLPGTPAGLVLTSNEQLLIVADGNGVAVLDAARAEAGCTPVRVALSTLGDVAWVTARGSNALLAFKTSLLLKDPAHALIASLAVGPAPVGLALIHHDTEVIVADSNRFAGNSSPQTLTLINVKQALAGHPALLGTITVGSFPRELTLDGQTLLLTNYTSATLSLIDLSNLP